MVSGRHIERADLELESDAPGVFKDVSGTVTIAVGKCSQGRSGA